VVSAVTALVEEVVTRTAELVNARYALFAVHRCRCFTKKAGAGCGHDAHIYNFLELPMDASLRTDCKNYLLAQNGRFSRQMAVYRLQFSLKIQ